jgi:F-type H+-transporting ATPase subunit b
MAPTISRNLHAPAPTIFSDSLVLDRRRQEAFAFFFTSCQSRRRTGKRSCGGARLITLDYSLFVMIVLFLVLLFGLNRLLYEPVSSLLDERKSKTEGRVRKAAELELKVEQRLSEYEGKLHAARAEIAEQSQRARQEAEKERDRILEKARAEAAGAVAQAKEQLQAEVDRLKPELLATVEGLSSTIASRLYPS